MRSLSALGPMDLRRRDFLIQCCQGASAAFLPACLRGLGWPFLSDFDSADAELSSREFHLHPHYRTPRPLDALLLKTQAGLDDFVTEKYADQIAANCASGSGDRGPAQYIQAGDCTWAGRISAGAAVRPEWLCEDSYC